MEDRTIEAHETAEAPSPEVAEAPTPETATAPEPETAEDAPALDTAESREDEVEIPTQTLRREDGTVDPNLRSTVDGELLTSEDDQE